MDSPIPMSFQQFLYDKFKSEYDNSFMRQPYIGKKFPKMHTSSNYKADKVQATIVRNRAAGPTSSVVPQIDGKSKGEHPNIFRSSPVISRSNVPQQLIVSKSIKLAPIKVRQFGSFDEEGPGTPAVSCFKNKPRKIRFSN